MYVLPIINTARCTVSRHILSHDDVENIVFKHLEVLYKSGLLKLDNLDKSLEGETAI